MGSNPGLPEAFLHLVSSTECAVARQSVTQPLLWANTGAHVPGWAIPSARKGVHEARANSVKSAVSCPDGRYLYPLKEPSAGRSASLRFLNCLAIHGKSCRYKCRRCKLLARLQLQD